MRSVLVKVAVGAVVLTVLGWLFVRSLHSTRAEPYALDDGRLTGWTLSAESASDPAAPVIVLRGPQEIVSGLFRQVFMRMMESLNAPAGTWMPVVLRGELDLFRGGMTADELVEAARDAGLESAVLEPRCMAHRRISQPGATRQVYFAVFDVPAFVRFREDLAARAASAGGVGFDAAALSPIVFIAASDGTFHRWLPLAVDHERDCVAPIDAR
jgi:hypothetical protein